MRRSLAACLALFIAASVPVLAAEGTAVGVNPDAVARLGSADRILEVGADISLGERIVTGASGQVQILFADQTRLVVGPQSALLIESYLMTGSGADKFAINALEGSFRFISGNGPKSAYSIRTPTASIAVRGTKFDVLVEDGRTEVMLYEGGVNVCSGGQCLDLSQQCDIASFGPGGAAKIGHGDNAHRANSSKFRFARFPSLLVSDFRVSGASQCTSAPDISTPASLTASDEAKIVVAPPKDDIDQGGDGGTGGHDGHGDAHGGHGGHGHDHDHDHDGHGHGSGGTSGGGNGSGGTGTLPDDDQGQDNNNQGTNGGGSTGGGSSSGGSSGTSGGTGSSGSNGSSSGSSNGGGSTGGSSGVGSSGGGSSGGGSSGGGSSGGNGSSGSGGCGCGGYGGYGGGFTITFL